MQEKPPPGSKEARDQGCTCPVMDNHSGRGSGYVDEEGNPLFWFNGECPIHGDSEHVAPDSLVYPDLEDFSE